MAASIEFNLNDAFRLWREQLSQSPHFRPENLDELESHLRDSVTVLQSKGLSADEAFLIGTRRVGKDAALEEQFAAENGGRGWRDTAWRLIHRYGNKVIHLLIVLYFTIGCFFVWGCGQIARMIHPIEPGRGLPGFTVLVCGLTRFWYVLPVLSAFYVGYVWFRKGGSSRSWFGFFAATTGCLVLLGLPTLVALLLPLIDFLNSLPHWLKEHTPPQ
jgi:hypothetical protein